MSNLKNKLDGYIGKSINKICPNKFHDFSKNHCAHFVSHAIGLDFSYQCREYKGGSKQPANIRVHEIFAKCPKVGRFEQAPSNRPVLAFVTRRDVVDLENKKMRNIPQKHIGIHIGGFIYHYSNSQEKVVKWKKKKFFDTFESIYAGKQGLFYGKFPGSDLKLNIDATGNNVPQGLAFELKKDGKKWFATAEDPDDNATFYVAREVKQPSKKFYGIYQKTSEYYGTKFKATDYVATFDHWAYLLHVTGYCESKNFFNLINTYDRAKFTFGFYQLAAHTPNDNLILLFRAAVANLPQVKEYFPELSMIDGRLHRINEDGGKTDLEEILNTGPGGAKQLQLFMNYLNPFRKTIEEQEVLQAARMMHWMTNDKLFRDAYVEVSNSILQRKMTERYNRWYDLDGRSDTICALVADIHHQGRAKKSRVRNALNSADPKKRLLTINPAYENRNKALRKIVDKLEGQGKLGQKSYDASNNEFI